MWMMWTAFIVLVLVLLALDLGVFHRKAHAVSTYEALIWTGVWIGVALLFSVFLYFAYEYHWLGVDPSEDKPDGRTAAVLFFTGYVLEKILSIDNVFVIAIIFSYFGVPPKYQHRVLFWGIVGALVMRVVMVLVGAVLIEKFHWTLYVFGAFLVMTAGKMLFFPHEPDPQNNAFVRLASWLMPVTHEYAEEHFTVRVDGRLMLTPLALALVAVESTDVMFAVDSIPAIFAITDDPFIVFSSNVFAMLGLRSLYFVLAGIMHKFYYLKSTLGVLMALIGLKMLLNDVLQVVPDVTYYTLGIMAFVVSAGVAASLIRAKRQPPSIEELSVLVERTHDSGILSQTQTELVQKTFRLSGKRVNDCLVPRDKMVALELNTSPEQVLELVRQTAHTRMPVYDGDIDNIVGIVNTGRTHFSLPIIGYPLSTSSKKALSRAAS
jgi:tellurite resistance protein TerC